MTNALAKARHSWFDSRAEALATLAATLTLAVVTFMASRGRSTPVVLADEISHLRVTAWLNGYDWSLTSDLVPWTAPLLGLLVSPVYWFDLEPGTIYRSILAFNAFITAMTLPVALRVVRSAAPETPFATCLCITLATLAYPSVIAHAQIVWAEPLLLFITWLGAYIALRSARGSGRALGWFAAALAISFFAVFAHARAIVLPAALCVLFVTRWALQGNGARANLAALAGLGAGTAIALATQAALRSMLPKQMAVGVQHSPAGAASRAIDALVSQGPETLLQIAAGQFAYLSSATLGICVLGALPVFRCMTAWGRMRKNAAVPVTTLAFYGVVCTLIALAVSALFLMQPDRLDHYFYGRYVEPFMSPLLATGLVVLLSSGNQRKNAALIALTGVLAAGLVILAWPNPEPRPLSYLMISGWNHLGFLGLLASPEGTATAIAATGFAAGLIALKSRALFVALAAALFLLQQPPLQSQYFAPRISEYAAAIHPLLAQQQSNEGLDHIVVAAHAHWRLPIAIQMQLRGTPVRYLNAGDELPASGEPCVAFLPASRLWPPPHVPISRVIRNSPHNIAFSLACTANDDAGCSFDASNAADRSIVDRPCRQL